MQLVRKYFNHCVMFFVFNSCLKKHFNQHSFYLLPWLSSLVPSPTECDLFKKLFLVKAPPKESYPRNLYEIPWGSPNLTTTVIRVHFGLVVSRTFYEHKKMYVPWTFYFLCGSDSICDMLYYALGWVKWKYLDNLVLEFLLQLNLLQMISHRIVQEVKSFVYTYLLLHRLCSDHPSLSCCRETSSAFAGLLLSIF